MPVPMNARTIFEYLRQHGYSAIAASGILGNIEQESGGNPEAGSMSNAGIIQWTPGNKAWPVQPIMTGNPGADLRAQLRDMIAWNNANGAGPGVLNRARTPQQAALLYMNTAERPAAWAANLPNRQSSAAAVLQAARSGRWTASGPTVPAAHHSGNKVVHAHTTAFNPVQKAAQWAGSQVLNALLQQLGLKSWKDGLIRLGLVVLGGFLVLVGISILAGRETVVNVAKTAVL